MKTGYVIARDHKTDLNRAREYRTADLTWSTNRMDAHRFDVKAKNAEFKWCRENAAISGNWDVFFYKD